MHHWLGSPKRYDHIGSNCGRAEPSSLSEHAHQRSFFQNSDISSKGDSRYRLGKQGSSHLNVRVMSRIERSYENCKIYDNSQDHWQSLCNLLKVLQGGPVQSYENCENYEIYDNSPDHLQYQQNLFKGLQGSPIESHENCKNYEIYDNSWSIYELINLSTWINSSTTTVQIWSNSYILHIIFTPHGRYELNKLTSLPICGFIAQLVEHSTSIVEVTGSNPVEALIFSGFFFPIA